MKMAPSKQNQRASVFINTNSTCFLCLKEMLPTELINVSSVTGSQNQSLNQREFCMRPILKHLKFNPANVFADKSRPKDIRLLTNDLAVNLCGSCQNISSNLSRYCIKIEKVQVKLNKWLAEFSTVLTKSADDNELSNKLQHCPAVKKIRRETRTQCETILQNQEMEIGSSVRQVISETEAGSSMALSTGGYESTQPDRTIQEKCRKCGFRLQTGWQLKYHERRCNTTRKKLAKSTPNAVTALILSTVPHTTYQSERMSPIPFQFLGYGPKDYVCCTICSNKSEVGAYMFRGMYGGIDHLRRHMLLDHPEWFLEPIRFSDCDVVEFRKICDKVLRLECRRYRDKKGDFWYTRSDVMNCNCSYCAFPINYRSAPQTKSIIGPIHMLEMHYDKLCPLIEEAQKNRPPPVPVITKKCRECHGQFSTISKLKRHENLCHKASSLPYRLLPKNHYRCALCNVGTVFKNERLHRIHLTEQHPHFLFKAIKTQQVSQSAFERLCRKVVAGELRYSKVGLGRSTGKYKCQHCITITMGKDKLYMHLFDQHHDVLEKMIERKLTSG